MANTREIRDAAEKAENKAREATAGREFEKAADYFSFAADAYLRIAKKIADRDKQGKCRARAGKLEQLSKQCRAAQKRGEIEAEPPAEMQKNSPAEEPPETESQGDELSLTGDEEDETVEVDIPGDDDQEPEESDISLSDDVATGDERADARTPQQGKVAPPPPVASAGVKIPKTKKLKRANLPGGRESSRRIAPPPARTGANGPKPAAPPESVGTEAAPAVGLPPEPDVREEDAPEQPRPQQVASDGDLDELAEDAGQRPASVVISLDNEDFPEQKLQPNEFSIDLSPRFTEHICKALTMGDVSQIASKFNKLADNLLRKAMGGDPRDELDLRFTALACREVADRLTSTPSGDPSDQIEQARRAYHRGERRVAAELYKKAAMALLGAEDDTEEKTSRHERQASEYLSFSSRLRQVGR